MAELMAVPDDNEITFLTSDKGHEYINKCNNMGRAAKAAIVAFNQQIQAGNDTSITYQAALDANAEQAAKNAAAIAEQNAISQSGLPAQAGQANKVFTTDGTRGAWLHASGFTGRVTSDFTIAPGEKLETCTTSPADCICTPPTSIELQAPFFVSNSRHSKGDVVWVVPDDVTYDLTDKRGNVLAVGDKIRIKPGQSLALQCRVPGVLEG